MSVKKKLIAGGGTASSVTAGTEEPNFISHTLVFPDDTNTSYPNGVYDSTGTSFIPTDFNLHGSHSAQENISSNLPSNPNIYCLTIGSNNRLIISHNVGGGNICYSDNNGDTFTVSTLTDGSAIPNNAFYSIVAHGNTVLAIGGGSTFRSTDNGATFSSVTGSGGIAVGTDGNGTWLVVGGSTGFSKSTDDGATWSSVTYSGVSGIGSASSVGYSDGTWVVGATDTTGNHSSFFYSTNVGLSWTTATVPVNNSGQSVRSLAHNGSGVWVAGSVNNVWYSYDNGLNWNSLLVTSGRVNYSVAYNHDKFWASAWDGYGHRIYEFSRNKYLGDWGSYLNVLRYKLPDVVSSGVQAVIATDNYLFYGGGSNLYRKVITSVEAGTASDCLVMYKNLSANGQEYYFDTVRGAGWRWDVSNNTPNQNNSTSGIDYLDFRSDGIQIGPSIGTFTTSTNQITNWKIFKVKEGFFDIVRWTGDGTTNRQIAHSLNAQIGMMVIFKLTGTASDYPVYHQWLASNALSGVTNGAVNWNNGDTIVNADAPWGSSNTAFTNSHFYVGSSNSTANAKVNASSQEYIAYIWANNPSEGIKCDSWLGTGTNAYVGPSYSSSNYVDLGFQPEFIWHRQPQSSTTYTMNDLGNGGVYGYLNPLNQTYSAASVRANGCVMEPKGVYRTGTVSGFNTNANEAIYMAIKKNMPTVTTGNDLLGLHTYSGNGGLDRELNDYYLGGDTYLEANPRGDTRIFVRGDSDQQNGRIFDRTMSYGSIDLSGGTTAYNVGHVDANGYGTLDLRIENSVDLNNSNTEEVIYTFKNAKNTFENFAYYSYGYTYGTGERAIPHNLESTPEFIWIKNHSIGDTLVYHKDLGISEYSALGNSAPTTAAWFTQAPDASNVYIDQPSSANSTASYVSRGIGEPHHMYLWSTLEGVTKVGSYVGTGTSTGDTLSVDCGFSAGTKMVIILDKRSAPGHAPRWWTTSERHNVYSGVRVIRDIGSSLMEIGLVNNIDLSTNSGFTVANNGGSSGVNLNVSGETYHYFAVAA